MKRSLIKLAAGFAALIITTLSIAQQPESVMGLDGLKEATELCRNITPANRRMAEAAGYDVGKLCKSLSAINTPPERKPEPVIVAPRKPDTATTASEAESTGDGDLKPFGYDLFAGEPDTFAPALGISVPLDYLLGPGDTLEILLYGKLNDSFRLEINRDGMVDFPELGPVALAGISFGEAKEMLLTRIAEQMIGVQASISLGELRSIQIFVLGEAHRPGAYTVSSLSTITNALFVSGGVNSIASLRNVQLKRAGNVIASLDLYDLLLKGDTANDLRLQSSDVIYIPPVGARVSVGGQVLRPAVYELKGETTVHQLVQLAGGLNTKAFAKSSRIERIDGSGFKTVVDVDLTRQAGRNLSIQPGDYLKVDAVIDDRKEDIVTLSGHVYHPGDFRWREGLRVSDIVRDISQLKSEADLHFALIRRELPPVGKLMTIFVDLGEALSAKGGNMDKAFYPRDTLLVFPSAGSREETLAKLLDELKTQARSGELAQVVSIYGTVRSPGEYPLTEGMTATQLIAAAGGLKEAAYRQRGELTRYDLSDPERATSHHLQVGLADAYGNPEQDPTLQPYDVLSIRAIPEFREGLTVTLKGEVRFPGTYAFNRGETLSEVIARAGGLTELAHSKAAVFTRTDVQKEEARQLEELRERLEGDIAAAALESVNEGERNGSVEEGERLLETLDNTQALGRLVIDLPGILNGELDDVQLKGGDTLVVPEVRQEVSVIGEVQHPTAHLYNGKLSVRDYIDLSGGSNKRADKKRIYVVKANGAVQMPGRSGWFSRKKVRIEPGDTVVVPLDVDRVSALSIWSEASQVVYQLALGAAAINSF